MFFFARKLQIHPAEFLTEKSRKRKKLQRSPSGLWRRRLQADRCAGESRRRTSMTVDWEAPLSDKEVDAPRCLDTSTLQEEQLHHLGLPHPQSRSRQSPETPSLDLRRRGCPLENSGEPRARAGSQIRGGAPQSRADRGEVRHHQKPLQRHRHLPSAAGWHTTTHT